MTTTQAPGPVVVRAVHEAVSEAVAGTVYEAAHGAVYEAIRDDINALCGEDA